MEQEELTQQSVLRRLGELAFGRANDAVKLALLEENAVREQIDHLDLSMLSEFKRSDKGVEIKVVDRVKALEELFELLDGGKDQRDTREQFYQALKETVEPEKQDDVT
jgi:hypothetical protein